MVCLADAKLEATTLERYDALHWQARQLICSWVHKAGEVAKRGHENPFEAFIYMWIAFNGWAACVTGLEKDAEIIRRLARCPVLRGRFAQAFEGDPDRLHQVDQFADTWPVFKAATLRERQVRYDGLSGRRAYVAEVFRLVPGIDFQPKCWNEHKSAGECPRDWAHTINAIYRVRCNLFHGEKSATEEMDTAIVKSAASVLELILREVCEIQ